MKTGLYPKLAWNGITKNKKIYLPYLLTCAGMVMMFYIISYLTKSDAVASMPGGDTIQTVLMLGSGVIGVFALIFLFYTHSFLIRRRKKEFGLYNILGMGKWNLARILIWESLIIMAFSLSGGLLCGILFSKAAELFMVHLLHGDISFTFAIEPSAVVFTLILFAAIFLLILANTLRQIRISKPVELLQGNAVGEKPPKANWLLALLGVAMLAGAYYISIVIKQPLSALIWFFIAVVMVVIATYLLFIAGSIMLCKLLQKRKGYYYQTNHFTSISSMVYRMKRNGAGLASICILSTMVLVMISSTACLYIGAEGSIRDRYPRHIVLDIYSAEQTHKDTVQHIIDTTLDENGLKPENVLDYRYMDVAGYFTENQVVFDQSKVSFYQLSTTDGLRQMYFIPLEDYNRIEGAQKALAQGEVLVHATKLKYTHNTIDIEGCPILRVIENLPTFFGDRLNAMLSSPSLFIIVPDMDAMEIVYEQQAIAYGDSRSLKHDNYGFDLTCEDKRQIEVRQQIVDKIKQIQLEDESFPLVRTESAARERGSFYAMYGGLFFLGILLGLVFIFAAVLIMYYKQISEGYEDQSRFEIMQKVGMTKKEIRQSINSQVLTVFFLPLLAAGVHIAFSFPMIARLLTLFNLTNTPLLIIVTAACYLLFALFYVFVYRITSGAYYGIVSDREGRG